MRWSTVYILGKNNFEQEVINQLAGSDVDFMEGSKDDRGLFLIWFKEGISLRKIKNAIGAKTVFKYRLKFYESLEEFDSQRPKVLTFSASEKALIKKMHDWEDALKASA